MPVNKAIVFGWHEFGGRVTPVMMLLQFTLGATQWVACRFDKFEC